jgi:ribosomal protein S18 acetylase RimI-like enzyme
VAWLGQQVFSCGALIPHPKQVAEIIQMSVAKEFRRHGMGSQILQTLIEIAKQQGFQQVVLEATSSWNSVVAFYLSHGFCISHQKEGDTYLALDI